MVPVDVLGDFLNMFLESGWIALYKLALAILTRLENTILEKEDTGEILSLLKPS